MVGQHMTIQKVSTYRQNKLKSTGQGSRKRNTRGIWEDPVKFVWSQAAPNYTLPIGLCLISSNRNHQRCNTP